MATARDRKVMLGVAAGLTLLTCFAASRGPGTSFGYPFPWQHHRDTGRTPVDYWVFGADVLILFVTYYATMRAFAFLAEYKAERTHSTMKAMEHSPSEERDTQSRPPWNSLYFLLGFIPVAILFFLKPWTSFKRDFAAHAIEVMAASTVSGWLAGTFGERTVKRIVKSIRGR